MAELKAEARALLGQLQPAEYLDESREMEELRQPPRNHNNRHVLKVLEVCSSVGDEALADVVLSSENHV